VRITYNAPVILTTTLLALGVMVGSMLTDGGLTRDLFTVRPPMEFSNPLAWFRLVSHILGHQDWAHLAGNFTFILLLGPVLEERYGSVNLLEMMVLTAMTTGLLSITVFSTGLLGASGIVFMMILLSSFTNAREGEIPLTFVLIAVLFLGREVIGVFRDDSVSQLAHIVGGLCGGAFGLVRGPRGGSSRKHSPAVSADGP
jgi:membrane associated rhomboid family serine protease